MLPCSPSPLPLRKMKTSCNLLINESSPTPPPLRCASSSMPPIVDTFLHVQHPVNTCLCGSSIAIVITYYTVPLVCGPNKCLIYTVVGVVWLNSVLQKRQSTVCMCMWGDRAEIRPIYVTVDNVSPSVATNAVSFANPATSCVSLVFNLSNSATVFDIKPLRLFIWNLKYFFR